MRIFVLILLILTVCGLNAKIIAEIGDYVITTNQLNKKVNELSDDYDYTQSRKIAFQKLVTECLLQIYAEKNEINVNDKEVETFIINQFGNHPSLQTEGIFDYDKYLRLLKTEKGQSQLENQVSKTSSSCLNFVPPHLEHFCGISLATLISPQFSQ